MSWSDDDFPDLASSGYRITSVVSRRYNCIAWAAGDESRWWWPLPAVGPGRGYWPPDVPRQESLETFKVAYATLGYLPCDSGDFEAGYEKVAVYVDAEGVPTHAARQLSDGGWSSKLGGEEDIAHTLNGLEGPTYGTVACFLRRRREEGAKS